MIHRRAGWRFDSGIGRIPDVRIVRVQIRLGVIARFDFGAGENRWDLIGRCVVAVLVPSDDEQTVVRHRPRQIGVDDVCFNQSSPC